MPELIAHEVEVAAIGCTGRQEAYHLVKSDTALHHVVLVALLEMPVHVGIHQAEDDGLVAHQSLVMALGIGDGLLILASVSELPEEGCRLPVLVALLLDGLNPVVGDVHGESVVEAIAAIADRCRESGHAAHVLGNGDGILVDLMYEVVGQSEIYDSLVILMTIVVVAIAGEILAQAVTVVKHRGDAIETETVKMELVEPILAVGKQEVHHLVLAVVKAEAVPCGMLTPVSLAEILARVAGKVAQPLVLIFHGMAVYDVHDHGNAHRVSLVDE